jgi:hypothetical protein
VPLASARPAHGDHEVTSRSHAQEVVTEAAVAVPFENRRLPAIARLSSQGVAAEGGEVRAGGG